MSDNEREIIVLRDVLQSIIDIGYNYDGFGESLEGCKSLIDEFVSMAKDALEKKQGISYLTEDDFGKGVIVNVFDEHIGEYDVKDKECKLKYYDTNRKDY